MSTPKIKLMEVCGTHTMAIARAGIKKLLPGNVELVSGPGCPVCVTAQDDIDQALAVARMPDVILATFGDMMRVPGTRGSLEEAKGKGCDVRIVYSPLDALAIAKNTPGKSVVFMGVGFETTSPAIAATLLEARKESVHNFFLLSHFKLIFPALEALARSKRLRIDGFLCPGHVSVITGSIPYELIERRYKKPCVITGFDTRDILKGIALLVDQIKQHTSGVRIEYKRAVTRGGNRRAQRILSTVFKIRDARWRGLGVIKRSGLALKGPYRRFDAERRFRVKRSGKGHTVKGCICGEILQGIKSPEDCALCGKVCTPRNPVGPCMVSSEGACAAYYKYDKKDYRLKTKDYRPKTENRRPKTED
jgi:hydrogenase expression/formation protein HypD